jgi:hypothetical protein
VLVIAGDEHGGAKEQVAPLVEFGDHRLDFSVGFTLPVARLPLQSGLANQAVVERCECLGRHAAAEILLDHPAVDPLGPVVVAAAIAAGFPGHDTSPKRRTRVGVAQFLFPSARADDGRDRRVTAVGRNPKQASAILGEKQMPFVGRPESSGFLLSLQQSRVFCRTRPAGSVT